MELDLVLTGFPALRDVSIGLFLWPISEGIWGQTIGKRILDLKVVTNEFKPIGIGQASVDFSRIYRLYVFDRIIIAANNKQNKRIGDLAANTIVVRTKSLHTTMYN